MLVRSKLETNWRACSSASRSTISPRVGVSAVAVSAMRGTLGKRSCNIVSSRYSLRKSCPHCETQCASSMAKRAIPEESTFLPPPPPPPPPRGGGGGGGPPRPVQKPP